MTSKDEIEAAIKWARFYDPRKSFEVRHLAVLIGVAESTLSPPMPDDVAEAVERARDEVRYCYEELHGRKPLKVGHGGKLTCGDLETLIRAASTPSAEVRGLRDAIYDVWPILQGGMTLSGLPHTAVGKIMDRLDAVLEGGE